MRTFVCHKRVKAAQILETTLPNDFVGGMNVSLNDGQVVTLLNAMIARYIPAAGDYLIEYEDGYRSISPKEAFEAGYSELGTVAAVLSAAEALATAGEALGDNPTRATRAEMQHVNEIGRRFEVLDTAMSLTFGDRE